MIFTLFRNNSMIRNILMRVESDKGTSPEKKKKAESNEKSCEREFVSSDMAADENWSQSSHSCEEAPEEYGGSSQIN